MTITWLAQFILATGDVMNTFSISLISILVNGRNSFVHILNLRRNFLAYYFLKIDNQRIEFAQKFLRKLSVVQFQYFICNILYAWNRQPCVRINETS